jgi:uncharacterized protein (DUF488 family)
MLLQRCEANFYMCMHLYVMLWRTLMECVPIYTIGYGNHSIEEIINLLFRYHIEYVIDVRSQPYSRYSPEFSKKELENHLQQQNIRYLFMGDSLGGRPADETCYVNGKVDYSRVCTKAFYPQGIQRLRTAWEKQLRVALLCAEVKPQECHRSKLIGNTLVEQHIAVAHIDETGECKTQQAVNQTLLGGQPGLFENIPAIEVSGKVGRARKKRPLPQSDLPG